MVSYIEGMLKISNLIFAFIAGGIALSMIRLSFKDKKFTAWRYLAVALILFAVQQLLGALRAFMIFESPFLTHVNVSVLLVFLLISVITQLNISGGKR